MWVRVVLGIGLAASLVAGCQVRGLIGSNVDGSAGGEGGDSGVGSTSGPGTSGGGPGTTSGTGGAAGTSGGTSTTGVGGDGAIFDVLGADVPAVCAPQTLQPCDHLDDDPWHAIGLGCDGADAITTSFDGSTEALMVYGGALGASGVFDPREGEKLVVLSSGRASQLPLTPDQLQLADPACTKLTCPSTDLGTGERLVLPAPLDVRRVDDTLDCGQDPSLVGQGDCSNTLWNQWLAGNGAYDYAELRVSMTVPADTDGFGYDFAFFSSEYPLWFDGHVSSWNDMYVAWLESESWTGNISFDEEGNPISVNSVLLDYMDGSSDECPDCTAPELHGFAMEGHAATKWLTTTAPVVAGEQIELVFAIFDLTDGIYDSLVVLDHFHWTCSGAPPVTAPAG